MGMEMEMGTTRILKAKIVYEVTLAIPSIPFKGNESS
jgi:hypothetical protein